MLPYLIAGAIGFGIAKIFEEGGETFGRGGITTNEGIIKSFLNSNKELRVGNLEAVEIDDIMYLRNYRTFIAKRMGDKVKISSQKYSKTTSTITNRLKALAVEMGYSVEYVSEKEIYDFDKFAGGGKVGMINYYIGGLVSEDIPFEYNGEETDINYEVGFHEGGIDSETFKETPSGYYVRIMPYGSTDIRRFIYPEKDIEIAYLSELRAITMLLFEADKDTKENQKIAIKEGKKNLPKLLKYMNENLEEEDRFRKNVRIVQDAMWGSNEDEEGELFAEGGEAKKRRRRANTQTGRTDRSVDKTRVGKPVGYRFSNSLASKLRKDKYAVPTEKQITKYLGKGIYKENRKNRSDKDRTAKL